MDGRVLVAVPTYRKPGGGLAIHPDTERTVRALKGNRQILWMFDNPRPVLSKQDGYDNLCHQLNQARQYLLDSDFTALLIIEHDMVVPDDAIEKLLNDPADIVYGVYLFRHGSPVLNAYRLTCMNEPDQSLTLFEESFPEVLFEAWTRGRVEVSGCGTGCTLIKRRVMEKLAFRTWEGTAPDIPLALDAAKAGYKQAARFDVICGHYTDSGELLWPKKPDFANQAYWTNYTEVTTA